MQANAYSGANHQQWSLEKYTLSVTAPQSQIVVGETMQIGKNSTALAITWSSSDKNVATVSSDGKVTGCNPGTATITAKAANGMTASCSIKVVDPNAVNYVNITKDSSGKYSLVLTKFNNGDFYFQAYSEDDNEWGELYALSQTNKNWLDDSSFNNLEVILCF